MLFEVKPEKIQILDSLMLVKLMKRLMHAECKQTGIPLSSAKVPLQITVPDGGEDGRVHWVGGSSQTDFFPDRFCIFQSKAQKLTASDVKNEIYKSEGNPESGLNAAILDVLQHQGAYIIFCSHPFTGQKIEDLCSTIKDTILALGGDPSDAKAIEIYDANKISDWVSTHPSVALWLIECIDGISLDSIYSYEGWGKDRDIATIDWIVDTQRRFHLSFTSKSNQEESEDSERQNSVIMGETKSFEETLNFLSEHIFKENFVIRIYGPSGFGKTRFAYELFGNRNNKSTLGEIESSLVIYSDYSVIGNDIQRIASRLADAGFYGLLVVDECPDNIHCKLKDIIQRKGSRLCLITIDIETSIEISEDTLKIELLPAANELIGSIAKSINPRLSTQDVDRIQQLSNGFPRMAVIAARQDVNEQLLIGSISEQLNKMVWGNVARPNEEAKRSLEAASLFSRIGIAEELVHEADFVAEKIAHVSTDIFIEALNSLSVRGITRRRGNYIQVQLITLATLLGKQRLNSLRKGKISTIFEDMPDALQVELLRQLRWLDTHPEAHNFARALLTPTKLGNFEALNSARGTEYLNYLVHIVPDLVMLTVDTVLGSLSLNELTRFDKGKQHLIWALDKLAFREQSFLGAATLLRKFSAVAEPSTYTDTATSHFLRLYQVLLSGTEASPDLKLMVLDEGLNSPDEREQRVCVEALDKMLQTGNFSRWGGNDEIGSSRLKDWQPATYGEIFSYHREGLKRLVEIAVSDSPFSERARNIISSHIRGLIKVLPFEDIEVTIDTVRDRFGFWPDALYAINEWLYFDSEKEPQKGYEEAATELVNKVRAYFTRLMPDDPVELIELYTYGWEGRFHNPDSSYQKESSDDDHEYATRKAIQLAEVITRNDEFLSRIINKLTTSDAKNCFQFAKALAESSSNPYLLFVEALERVESDTKKTNQQFFKGLLSGIDNLDSEQARNIIDKALRTEAFGAQAIELIRSIVLQPKDIPYIVSLLKHGLISPQQCVWISYGRGLQHLNDSDLEPLLSYLKSLGASGLWAALEIIFFTIPDRTEPSDLTVSQIQSVLLANEIFDYQSPNDMSDHYFKESVKLMLKHKKIVQSFVSALVQQLYSICNEEKAHVFNDWYRLTKELLKLLVKDYPETIWNQTVNLINNKVEINFYALNELLTSDGDSYFLEGGLLYELPSEVYLDWVREDPDERASTVISWLPIARKRDDGTLDWHSDLENFILEFHGRENVLSVLESRLYPKSFIWRPGSPHLQPILRLLEVWFEHPASSVRQWAHQQVIQTRQEMEHFDRMHLKHFDADV